MQNDKDENYHSVVISAVDELSLLNDEQLLELPEYTFVEKTADAMTIDLGIYHSSHPKGFEVFIVQAKRYIFWRYGHMFVEGFVLYADGRREALPEEVRWEYE